IAFLGIESSPAFVRAPEGNGCAERFIGTLKENLLRVGSFDSIEELRQALLEFRQTYNTTWLIGPHGFLTPANSRQKQLKTAAIDRVQSGVPKTAGGTRRAGSSTSGKDQFSRRPFVSSVHDNARS